LEFVDIVFVINVYKRFLFFILATSFVFLIKFNVDLLRKSDWKYLLTKIEALLIK